MEDNTVYVTKYALTKGILKCRVKSIDKMENGIHSMVTVNLNGYDSHFVIDCDAFMSLDDAMWDFVHKKYDKIESLSEKIEKLNAMEVKVKEVL